MNDESSRPDEDQLHDDASGPAPAMPHDRDESARPAREDGLHRQNRKVIEQGRRDVESGIEDTERIGVPTRVPDSGRNDGGKN